MCHFLSVLLYYNTKWSERSQYYNLHYCDLFNIQLSRDRCLNLQNVCVHVWVHVGWGGRADTNARQSTTVSSQHVRDLPWPAGCWPTQHWKLWSLARPVLDVIFLLTQHYHFFTFDSPLLDTRLSKLTATEIVNQAEIV